MISKTVINVKSEEEFLTLVEDFKNKLVKGIDEINLGVYDIYLSETCIVDEDKFAFGSVKYFTDIKCKIITLEEYLKHRK
jgi:hypothetical protein